MQSVWVMVRLLLGFRVWCRLNLVIGWLLVVNIMCVAPAVMSARKLMTPSSVALSSRYLSVGLAMCITGLCGKISLFLGMVLTPIRV